MLDEKEEDEKDTKTLHLENFHGSIEGPRAFTIVTGIDDRDSRILEAVRIVCARLSGNGAGLDISARNDGRRPTAIGRHCQGVLSTAGQIGRHG